MHHLPIRAHAATAVALLLVVALSAPDTWGGSVIRVPGDFATIQAAVDAARPGDTIQVGPGVYCENIVIQTSGLRLRTQPGANRAVIDGTCLGGIGSGIHVMRAEGVQIMGFLVEHFRMGIYLHSTSRSRVHLNEVRFNATGPGLSGGHGIILDASSFNAVDQNDVHDNGHLGIGVHGASSGNVVRGNRLRDNNLDSGVLRNCNLMVWNGATDNWIMENLLVGGPPELGPGDLPGFGTGIMIGPGIATGNHVEQNRVHGFAGPGIIVMSVATENIVEQNDARNNGRAYAAPMDVDLYDQTDPADNQWNRNLGTCAPSSTGVC